MPTFQQLLDELNKRPQPEKQIEYIDSFRKQKIKEIKEITKRDVLVYFSDLKKNHPAGAITWDDKTCFADIVEGLDKKGVDVIIHSPGGSAEATESLVCMLHEHFDNIRFIVPNMAKSAATMLVLSGDEILMDDRSELGPIDPQILIAGNFVPAQTLIDGFEEAKKIGIKVTDLRDNHDLRTKVWELYCVLEILLDRAKNIPFQPMMIPQMPPQEQKVLK